MPYDINYSNVPGGRLLETQYGVGNAGGQGGGFGGQFGGSMTGPAMPDMSAFYQAMAQRQAEQENYKRQQQADALARQQEAMRYDRRKSEQATEYQRDQDSRRRMLMNDQREAMNKRQAFDMANSGEDHDVHLGEADQYMGFKGFGHLGAGDRGPIALQYKRKPNGDVF